MEKPLSGLGHDWEMPRGVGPVGCFPADSVSPPRFVVQVHYLPNFLLPSMTFGEGESDGDLHLHGSVPWMV